MTFATVLFCGPLATTLSRSFAGLCEDVIWFWDAFPVKVNLTRRAGK